ncbi:hypothetical protein J4G33_13465 [Actinotalea sp. BY-33]|uniref:Uncharacterized protein n=1 Tax=Actinotalea soli TaxID=2819234 RepID=A0A939RX41_9CELL|nr:hypothetical protein [Actinotalea soli]MBO1752816.1 hypothetical protein [Actinotalea soli]
MSTLAISVVRTWDPGALLTAADRLRGAGADLDHQVQGLRSAMDVAATGWSGPAADAAAARVEREVTAGRELSAAVETARAALEGGGSQLTSTRSTLLSLVADAEAMAFSVRDDGAVTAPTLPPVMTAVGDTTAAAERDDRQRELNGQAQARATSIGQALSAVAAADASTEAALLAVEVPASLSADAAGLLERLRNGTDALTDLIPGGAGAIALGHSLQKAWAFFGRTRSFTGFLTSTWGQLRNLPGSLAFIAGRSADATAFARFTLLGRQAAEHLRTFQFGKPLGGLAARVPGLATAARVAGKAFLPLTVVTGGIDAVTGGGYEGGRGATTRVLGVAGAGGALALGAAGLGLVALGPVGLAVAGGAVLAYGAWSLGNLVYDNWGEITDFTSRAAGWVGDKVSSAASWTGDRLGDAADWAGDRVSDARALAGAAVDRVGETVSGAREAVEDGLARAADTGRRMVDGALSVLSLGF